MSKIEVVHQRRRLHGRAEGERGVQRVAGLLVTGMLVLSAGAGVAVAAEEPGDYFEAPALTEEDAAAARERIARFMQHATSLRSEFSQTLLDPGLNPIERSSGVLMIKRPDRFRWDYTAPYEQLIVADGEKLWMYDKELAQVTVRDMDESLASTPAALLSGADAIDERFEVRATFRAGDIDWIQLAPKQQDTDFRQVRLGFAGDTLRLMELTDSLDQVTRIDFGDIDVNPEIDDSRFAFEPPPDADLIDASAMR